MIVAIFKWMKMMKFKLKSVKEESIYTKANIQEHRIPPELIQ